MLERAVIATEVDGAVPVWSVSALLRAMDDSLQARFNPVSVQGEISGLTRASSGHCYFVLKDEQGQIRCALFRRAASMLDFAARDGQRVQVRGRLSVYGPRGELQLVVESLRRWGRVSFWSNSWNSRPSCRPRACLTPSASASCRSCPEL